MKLTAIFYQLGAPVWRAPSRLATMLLLPYIKVNIRPQTGSAILHVLRLHVSATKEPERKLNRNALLNYLLGRNWEASMPTLMMIIHRKLG